MLVIGGTNLQDDAFLLMIEQAQKNVDNVHQEMESQIMQSI